PRHAIKLRRWYWVGFAGLPLGIATYEIVGEPGWALALILLAPVVAAVLAGLKFGDLMQRVEEANFKVCTECGYDLQAHPPAGTCPECGRKYVIASNIMLWKNWCMVRDKPRKR
ncbi:MAG TPA: hypothetical protein VK146_05200, partial [Tabrizicola sp.]|nr:hypothetical protein [Tabrizicola sp.]